jgi:hypothetical protein
VQNRRRLHCPRFEIKSAPIYTGSRQQSSPEAISLRSPRTKIVGVEGNGELDTAHLVFYRRSRLLQFRIGIDLGLTMVGDKKRLAPVEGPIAIRVSRVIALITGLERKYEGLRMIGLPFSPSALARGHKPEIRSGQTARDGLPAKLGPQTFRIAIE